MATTPFPCTAQPMTSADLNAMLADSGVDLRSAWTLLDVETHKFGYLPDRRPKILFESALFHSLTHGQYDATHPGISSASGGGYQGGAAEYTRLGEAYALNPDAALQSASWGLGQVLGLNYKLTGAATVTDFVQAACASEANQLKDFTSYILKRAVAGPLAAQQWTAVAHNYNGSGNVADYATALTKSYAALADPASLPDLTVRAAQLYLTFLASATSNPALSPGGVDGVLGTPGRSHTLRALNAFQAGQGLPVTQSVDTETLTALAAALPAAPVLSLT